MSLGIQRLDCDNLVIGGGLSGLVAALRRKGKTIVASAGMGATAISGGVLSSPARDVEVDSWFVRIMRQTGCKYRESRCMTDLMAIKAGLVQEIMDYGACDAVPVMFSIDGTSSVSGVRSLDLHQFRGRSYQEIARLIDTDGSILETIAAALKETCVESALLPPILGIDRTSEVQRSLERSTGAGIFEYVNAPSVQGFRLLTALRGVILTRRDITVLDTARIESIAPEIKGRMGTKSRREFYVDTSSLIIATGGLMTGLRVDGDRVIEPLTGRIVGDVNADLSEQFLADHPLMFTGIGTRPAFKGGFKDVYAAGAVALGFGLYNALTTGYHAGSNE
ncbi:MAG TPA: FAD-binding protein [Methanocella sp.]|nr:FAD-binding protein [Methanocella sp.]